MFYKVENFWELSIFKSVYVKWYFHNIWANKMHEFNWHSKWYTVQYNINDQNIHILEFKKLLS